MTYQLFVRPEAIEDFNRWLIFEDHAEINPWLCSMISITTPISEGWVVINVDRDIWYAVKDNFPTDNL